MFVTLTPSCASSPFVTGFLTLATRNSSSKPTYAGEELIRGAAPRLPAFFGYALFVACLDEMQRPDAMDIRLYPSASLSNTHRSHPCSLKTVGLEARPEAPDQKAASREVEFISSRRRENSRHGASTALTQ